MKFWDSSAILALLLKEQGSFETLRLYRDDVDQAVWCLTEVEVASALSRRVREGIEAQDERMAQTQLAFLITRWTEIASLESVRGRAVRLLSTHSLRAGDALQLAAALVFCDERTDSLPFVCLDDRLADAARKERFPVLP
ncbi:MAG: type II toxin-antitoxin system VapC family toxin [Acidobacteriota bacterium]